jgi:Ca-activated chloride channel family protein
VEAIAQYRLGAIESPIFASRARLVLVPVTVTNSEGAFVNGLSRDQFSVSEDKASRPIASFSEEDDPVSVGVILDRSGSMRGALADAKSTLRALFQTCNPEDEGFVHLVSTRPSRISGFTCDFGRLLDMVAGSTAEGDTALIDTIYGGLMELRHANKARKALVVISDGMDNHSARSKGELMSVAMESEAQIYAISLFSPPLTAKAIEVSELRRGLLFLSELAQKTGGIHVEVRGPSDIDPAVAQIGRALRNRYVIGYVPAADPDGRSHSIKVKVSIAGAHVYARQSYRAE